MKRSNQKISWLLKCPVQQTLAAYVLLHEQNPVPAFPAACSINSPRLKKRSFLPIV